MVKVDPRTLAGLVGVTMGLAPASCNSSSAPTPIRVSNTEPALQPARAPQRTGPFRNPKLDAPEKREGTQLNEADLEEILTQARKAKADGNDNEAIRLLRKCANKEQPSGRCEGELALILLPLPAFKADANYFIDQACALDDPAVDADFYVELGQAANMRGRMNSAATAFRHALDRGKDDADTWVRYAGALQSDPGKLGEAAVALARAYERDPTRHKLMLDRATLLAQIQDHDQAARLMREYLETDKNLAPARRKAIESRSAELESFAARDKKANRPERRGQKTGDANAQ